MNSLVTASPQSYSELEFLPVQRPVSRATPIEQLIAAIYRQRWVLIASLGIMVLAAVLFSMLSPKQYTAVASVQLEQQTPQVFGANELDPQPAIQDSDRFLQTQLDRVRSRSIADAVASKLKVEKSPATLAALGVETEGVTDPATLKSLATSEMQTRVAAKLGLNTRLAQITFTSGDADVSANMANGFAEALAEANVEAKIRNTERAKQILLQQLAKTKQRLESSEQEMLRYARNADLTTTIVPTGGNNDRGGSLRSQQLGTLTDALSDATSRRIAAQQRWSQVQGANPLTIPEVEGNQAVQNLIAQRAQLQAALEEGRARYTDNYPTVRETAAKIRELDTQIGSVASNIKSSVQGQYVAAARQEQQMASTVANMRGAAMSERERSVGFNSLSREVETTKASYDGLLQRYKQVAAASGAAMSNVNLIDRAWPPLDPDSSNLVRNVALAGMVGLVLALFVGGIRERMHHVVRSSEDLEQATALPTLGVVPKVLDGTDARIALASPRSAQAEAFHSIAAEIEESTPGGLPKTLLITSSVASEGKSTAALGIARSLSAMGKRVLLVDGDLRRPTTTQLLGGTNKPGLTDAISGTAVPENTVDSTDQGSFHVVHAGAAGENPVPLLATKKIKKVFDRLAATHDIVIIDGPPIMGLADSVLLARSVEAVLIVVEANRTHISEVDVAVSRLSKSNVIGGIITKFDAKTAGVRYGDYDYYSYQAEPDQEP